jgi:predicted SprT family Zn-dependent metalloprotease
LEAWETEKERYELKGLGTGGPFAYALKEDAKGADPAHYICASCYQRGEKSILQQEFRVPGRDEVLVCHKCGSDLYVNGMPRPEHFRGRRSR